MPSLDPRIHVGAGISRDSRSVKDGQTFFAMAVGEDRSRHIAQAITNGAGAIVCADPAPTAVGVPVIVVQDPRRAYALASVHLHGLAEQCPPLVGVTGTDGKTTVAEMIRTAMGSGSARIGTLGFYDGYGNKPGTHTTPPSEDVHAFLRDLPEECPGVAVEISSHAGDQGRLYGLPLQALAFTNLGSDHLDYHKDRESYLQAKIRITELLVPGGRCVVNADAGEPGVKYAAAAAAVGAEVITLGREQGDVVLERSGKGWVMTHNGQTHEFILGTPGGIYAWNAAAAALLVESLGISVGQALTNLMAMDPVPGRLEALATTPLTFVDYACTPEAIERVLGILREEYPHKRLLSVFGCGGDRDRSKRGPMGRAALTADIAVLTTDNCRSEAPEAIAEDVIAGQDPEIVVDRTGSGVDGARMVVELQRREAIDLARTLAGPDGVVAVLGKGHEDYQIIGDTVTHWSDRDYVAGLAQQ